MTTRYRVEYALKSHRRDEFIEWMKSLLSVPFVLHAGSSGNSRTGDDSKSSTEARRKYAEILFDVEKLIEQQVEMQERGTPEGARLRQLIPSVGLFFTRLPLERAFYAQDDRRAISKRRLVSPSFNDIRLILNTAQVMALGSVRSPVKLVTFDGDVTLYDDGKNLEDGSEIIGLLLGLLKRDVYVGIVTAAGYSDRSGEPYLARLGALVRAIVASDELTTQQKCNLVIMGGESNFLFRLGSSGQLDWIEPQVWELPEVSQWEDTDITKLLNLGESVLTSQMAKLGLPAQIIRKERSVGLVPAPGHTICREALEEVVLNAQRTIEVSEVGRRVHFCAFNGGSDVWVDIGDKRYGVLSLQRYLGGIVGGQTLHVGDQFASIGANDFKARLAACTVWIANPHETISIIEELITYLDES